MRMWQEHRDTAFASLLLSLGLCSPAVGRHDYDLLDAAVKVE